MLHGMKTSDAIESFGGVPALAKALRVTQSAIYQWGDEVPRLRGYEIRDILAERNASSETPDFPDQDQEAA
jgi:hypothetical protein